MSIQFRSSRFEKYIIYLLQLIVIFPYIILSYET